MGRQVIDRQRIDRSSATVVFFLSLGHVSIDRVKNRNNPVQIFMYLYTVRAREYLSGMIGTIETALFALQYTLSSFIKTILK